MHTYPAHLMVPQLSADDARSAIVDLADHYSWETIAREMIVRMSGDEARDFLADFQDHYGAS